MDYFRDANTQEANQILDFCGSYHVKDSEVLFVYFAEYRERYYKEIPFDPSTFKERLKKLCREDDHFRHAFAWNFWRSAQSDKEERKKEFDEIEEYWKLLFVKYDKSTFDFLYKTLEVTLEESKRYKEHKELLKNALKSEMDFYRSASGREPLWDPSIKIFEIILKNSVDDFLDIVAIIANNLHANMYSAKHI